MTVHKAQRKSCSCKDQQCQLLKQAIRGLVAANGTKIFPSQLHLSQKKKKKKKKNKPNPKQNQNHQFQPQFQAKSETKIKTKFKTND
jgi:hypothetical protein